MIRSALMIAAFTALAAAPAYAAGSGRAAKSAPRTVQTASIQGAPSQTTFAPAIPTLRDQCSRDNPFIEYRDCVNASTRDPNAKVRLG
jgi:hypothetical protein